MNTNSICIEDAGILTPNYHTSLATQQQPFGCDVIAPLVSSQSYI